MNPLEFINQIKDMYNDQDPRPMAQEPRNTYSQGQLVTPSVDGSRPGYAGKDKRVLDEDTIKKIKNKIKLKVGQKWNFFDPETNPKGHTYGVPKGDPNYEKARNFKPGRVEASLLRLKKKYQEIKADPKLLAEKKAYDRKRFLRIRDVKNKEANLKYAMDKDFRQKKLDWAKADRIKNPEKYKKKMSDYYAKKGRFPPGNNYKEHVWRDMFRSSQKSGQSRFLLVDESGKLLTEDKFPKVDGKVRWDVGGAYKNVKFYDTKTKQFVKFDNTIKGKGIGFEKYLDQKSVGGKGAYKNAVYGYKIKDDYKNLTFKDSKGKKINFGKFMQNKMITGDDFLNSGIHVQHPDLNNAFWKNEVTLASSNMELKKLEMNIEQKLRAFKDDPVKRTKALEAFKTKIEKLPGGATKVIEGTTYGIKPTERGVIQAAGKEFGATRYKDFANLLKKLCPKGQASGGRIGYQTAGAVTGTLECGINQFNKNLKTGNANSALMRRILANGGNILKGAAKTLNPAELLRLRNLIGPQALGFFAAYEAGDITDDILRKNIPVNEALSKNWLTKTFLPYREQGARAKNLLQSGKLTTDAQKKYALDLMKLDQAIIKQEQLEQMKLDQGLGYGKDESGITNEMIDAAEKDLERRFNAIGDSVFTEGSAIGQEYQALEDEMIASRLDEFKLPFQSDKGTRLVNKLARPSGRRLGPMTAKREMKVDFSLPTYDRNNITEQDVINMYKDEGWISPMDYKSGYKLSPGELTWWRMQDPGRGTYGTQEKFMGGGMVGIRKPHAIPPERQGLRSIMINVNDD